MRARRERRIAKRREQERLIAEGKICGFGIAWHGPCGKPTPCPDHAAVKCVVCGKRATGQCDGESMGLVCGANVCDTCNHHGHRR